jgi:hypothetical protein
MFSAINDATSHARDVMEKGDEDDEAYDQRSTTVLVDCRGHEDSTNKYKYK